MQLLRTWQALNTDKCGLNISNWYLLKYIRNYVITIMDVPGHWTPPLAMIPSDMYIIDLENQDTLAGPKVPTMHMLHCTAITITVHTCLVYVETH